MFPKKMEDLNLISSHRLLIYLICEQFFFILLAFPIACHSANHHFSMLVLLSDVKCHKFRGIKLAGKVLKFKLFKLIATHTKAATYDVLE